MLMAASAAQADSLKLAWNASPSAEVSGYNIYYGEISKQYTHSVDVGNTTNHTLTGIQPGKKFYIAIAAYCHDCEGFQESDFSNELEVVVPSIPDNSGVIPQKNLSLVYVDSEETRQEDGRGVNAFDGNPNTFWVTQWSRNPAAPLPHEVQINLGATYELTRFRYLPTYDTSPFGRIKDYAFYVSGDGKAWGNPVARGTFPNTAAEQEVVFNQPVIGQFIRLVALSEVHNGPWTAVGEINVIGLPASDNSSTKAILEASTGKMVSRTDTSLALQQSGHGAAGGNELSDMLPPPVELGEVRVSETWQKVSFRESFLDPVVITSAFSDAGPVPGQVRIRHVTGEGFEIRLQGWDWQNDARLEAQVPFLAMEKGHYTLPNGAKMEAGTLEAEADATFEAVEFLHAFTAPPVVLTSVTSDNDPHPVAVSKQAIRPDGFELRLQRLGAEASAGTEAVDYIAVEPSVGMAGTVPFEIGQAEQVTSQAFQDLTFLNRYENLPLVMADFQTRTTGAMTGLRWKEKTAESIHVKVDPVSATEEEETDDTTHTLGYIVFGLEE